MTIVNKSKNTIIASKAKIADTFLSRMIGLINRKSLEPQEALIIKGCKSIHMMFMRFSIDAIFVDKDNRVAGCAEELRSFRFSPIFWKADYVIELPAGAIKASQTQPGDIIVIN